MAKQPESVTKGEAIRQTLAAGITTANDAIAHIKKTFGLDVTRGHFSAEKSHAKSAAQAPEVPKRGRPPGKANAVVKAETPEPEKTFAPVVRRGRPPGKANRPAVPQLVQSASPEPKGESGMIADLTAVKALVQRLGAAEVKAIADLFE